MNTNLNKTVIITGVTGQMGSYFADFLLGEGFKVIGVIRRLSVPNQQNIKHISNDNFVLESMDLGDAHSINSIVEKYKPNYFINCAANSFVGNSWNCPEQHFEYNTLGVLRQLEAIKRFSPSTRYLNFGSSEEFGDVLYSPQNELHPPRSRSPYGASKVAARQIVKVYRESYNLYAIQCWCFNYESERRGEEFVSRKITKGLSRIVKSISRGEKFAPIHLGNINAERDWSHARDTMHAVWRMLNQERYTNVPWDIYTDDKEYIKYLSTKVKEYVVSSDESHSVRDFIRICTQHLDYDVAWVGEGAAERLVFNEHFADKFKIKNRNLIMIDPQFYRPADVNTLLGDSSNIREELGWTPKISFDNLVKRMLISDLHESGYNHARG